MRIKIKELNNKYEIDEDGIIYNLLGKRITPRYNGSLYFGKLGIHQEFLQQKYLSIVDTTQIKEIPILHDYYCDRKGMVYKKIKCNLNGYVLIRYQKLKQTTTTHGYKSIRVHQRKKHYMVHRLIMLTFCNNYLTDIFDVNHIDGDKTNNNIDNLEWCSRADNISHAYNNELHKGTHILQYDLQGNFIKEWITIASAIRVYGSSVDKCVRGERKQARGFIWRKK